MQGRKHIEGQAGETQPAAVKKRDLPDEDVMVEAPLDLNADISLEEMQMMQAMGIPFVRTSPCPCPWPMLDLWSLQDMCKMCANCLYALK